MLVKYRRLFWPTILLLAVTSTALALISVRTRTVAVAAKKTHLSNSQQANDSTGALVNSGLDYVRRGRLRPQLQEALTILGDRLEKPGKERLTLVGALSRYTTFETRTVPVRLMVELPNRLRLEEQEALGLRVTTFNGREVMTSSGSLSRSDRDLVESLVFDSAEHCFTGQSQGLATRYLGPRFRLDELNDKSPTYNIYQSVDLITMDAVPRQQSKFYYFNSDTLLLERVSYETERDAAPIRVAVQIAGWHQLGDQQVPSSITRLENEQPVWSLTVGSALVGPRVPDGIFGN
jgi:hypothetical protein